MPSEVPPPTQVLTFVFLAWMCGTATIGAITRAWGQIEAGHFKVVWLVVAGLALAAGFGYAPAWIMCVLGLVTFFFARSARGSRDRIPGALTAAASLVVLGVGEPLYAFAAAAFVGAVTNAMLLGHWHLNQPHLPTSLIGRLVWFCWAGIAVFISATARFLIAGSPDPIQVVGAVTAIAFASFACVLMAMVQHLVRTRSIMSATGILYLEILLALVAVFTGSLGALAAA